MNSEQRKSEAEQLRQQAAVLDKQQRFIASDSLGLRAVTEADLYELAALMAQCPLAGRDAVPWTEQRLKKEFEDEKEPGLWSETKRTYLAVDVSGGIVGFIQQNQRGVSGYEFYVHIAESHSDRDMLGHELMKLYMQLLSDWVDPPRLETFILKLEGQKADWLAAAGFELECTFDEMYMYLGRPEAAQIWGWVSPRIEDQAG